MASVLHRTTKQFLSRANTPDYSTDDWIINPDLSLVEGQPIDYWIIEGDTVRLATESEQNSIDRLAPYKGMTIEQVVAAKQQEINRYRDNYIDQGIVFVGHLFDIDQRARENITGMCSAVSLGVTIPEGIYMALRKLNEDVPMDAATLVQFGVAAMTFVSVNFSASWYHKDTLTSMISTATIDDILDYDFTVGWPNISLDGSSLQSPEEPEEM